MTRDEERYQRIENYLDGIMPADEQAAFEKAMQADAGLKQEVALHRQLQHYLADEVAIHLRNVLREVNSKTTKTPAIPLYRRPISIAAALLVLVMAVYFNWNSNRGYTKEQLFDTYFEPYQVVFSDRSETNLYETRNAAINTYQEGRYREAIELFSQLKQQDSLGTIPDFYIGICYLAAGSTDSALAKLVTVKQTGNPLFTEQATWYLGLAYLKQGKATEACSALNELQKTTGYKQKEAISLMKEICP